jgi:hypothetical protein
LPDKTPLSQSQHDEHSGVIAGMDPPGGTPEFPEPHPFLLFSLFLIDFSQEISCVLPFNDLKKDLLQLGYSEIGTDNKFSNVKQ